MNDSPRRGRKSTHNDTWPLRDLLAGAGRNNLIIGRKLTTLTREACLKLGITIGDPAVALAEPVKHPKGTQYSLAGFPTSDNEESVESRGEVGTPGGFPCIVATALEALRPK